MADCPFVAADRLADIRKQIVSFSDITHQEPIEVANMLLGSFMTDEEIQLADAMEDLLKGKSQ